MRRRLMFLIVVAIIFATTAVSLYASSTPGLEIKKIVLDPSGVLYDTWVKEKVDKIKLAEDLTPTEVTLFVAGDIMMSRNVESKMLKKKDFSYCLAPTTKISSAADIALANLESPIIDGPVVPTGSFSFRANSQSVGSLSLAGFDVLSLANNHFGNQGQKGMLSTFKYLTDKGIQYIGAAAKAADIKPVIIDAKGLKIAFLGYSYGPNDYAATDKAAGLALMNIEKMTADVKAAKALADLVVVSMHDGIEYVNDPSEHQKKFAHAAIDAGADLIVGHHPHVVQKMEVYKGKYIFYSLGNYVFDQMWSTDTRQGLAIEFHLDKSGVKSLDYLPVIINDYCQPNWALEPDRTVILNKLK